MSAVVARCALALLAAAARLDAQTLPRPRSADPPPPAGRTEYAFGLGAGWDEDGDAGAAALVPHGGVARSFLFPRGALRLDARGRAVRHPGERGLDRHEASLAADAHHRSSALTTWRASASLGVGEGDASPIALDHALLLPAARVRTSTVTAGVARALTPRVTVRVEGRLLDTAFDSPGLRDGRSLRAQAGVERRLGPRTSVGLVYAAERAAATSAPSTFTHYASAQWTRRLSARNALLLEGGASFTHDAARAGLDREASLFGGASLSRALRHGTLSAFVRREVTPAFGSSGARLDLRGGVAADVDLGRAWAVRVAAFGTRASGTHPSGTDAMAAVGRRLGGRLALSAEARYRRRSGLSEVESFRAGLFLTVVSPGAPPVASTPGF